jgi:sugar transferase (PEP-CTERM system associated)
MLNYHFPQKNLFLLLGDFLFIAFSLLCAIFVRTIIPNNIFNYFIQTILFFVIIYPFIFYFFDLYNLESRFKSTSFLAKFIIANLLCVAISSVSFHLLSPWYLPRDIFMATALFITTSTFIWRLYFETQFDNVKPKKNLAIIGAGWAGETIYKIIQSVNGSSNYKVFGFFDDNEELHGKTIGHHVVFGDTSLLITLAQKKEIDAAVIAITNGKKPELFKNTLDAKMEGIEIYDMPSLYEQLTGKIPVKHIRDSWLVYAPLLGTKKNVYTKRLKRLLDVVISVVGIIITLPISVIVAGFIKLDSKGTVFYKQKRVGQNNKVFNLVKFRSMNVNAEENGAVWARKNDDRVTRIGTVIRKSRIDEIPQMWNVLKGDMSFIGPRPERPEFMNDLNGLSPYYTYRHSVKPGITGWAQVNFKYAASREDTLEKLQYDLYYIKNMSFLSDLHILLKTINVVLLGKGAR